MAGADAREVFLFIVLANAEHSADGSIGGHYANISFLSDALQRDEVTVRAGLKSCVTFRLLHIENDEISIVGWDDEWRTKSSTDRVRKHRERKRNQTLKADETLHETLRNVTVTHVTPQRERERERRGETLRNVTVTHETLRNVSSKREVTTQDLENAYSRYPVKKGKAVGLAKAKKTITALKDFEVFARCIEHMAKAYSVDKTYCPHFSTFVNQRLWEDDDWPSPGQQLLPDGRPKIKDRYEIAVEQDISDENNKHDKGKV